MKIVINDCFGGFSISDKALIRMRDLGSEAARNEPLAGEYYDDGSGPKKDYLESSNSPKVERNDPMLVQVVEELGKEANGDLASLKIVEIPDDVNWTIEEYDGSEWVVEAHRTWE